MTGSRTITLFRQELKITDLFVLVMSFLFLEGIVNWIFVRHSLLIEGYAKVLSLIIFPYMIYRFKDLRPGEKIFLVLFCIMMLQTVFDSLAHFNSFFKEFTMYTVLFPVVYTIYMKFILREMDLEFDLLQFTARFYLVFYIIFMLLFGRGFSFSLEAIEMDDYGPFSADTRIIHASHILMMIVPFLWYLHKTLETGSYKFALPFIFCFAVILLHQHRSVWSSTLVALAFYLFMFVRNNAEQVGRFARLTVTALVVLAILYFFILNLAPQMVDFMADRFSEILDPAKENSTGNFRMMQRETYFPMVLDRPVFGWGAEGFEMPNPLVDWWPDGSGQHFHEGYMEMLFYEGFAGLLLKYSFLIYFMIRAFSKNLSAHSTVLIAFGISGMVFSLNYVLPLIFWGFVGMGMYYLDIDKDEREQEEVVPRKITIYKTPKTSGASTGKLLTP